MAIPDFQTLMRPVLEACTDGDEHRTASLVEAMADRFDLSEEEREELVLSGQQRLIANRTHWAITYLVKASLLHRVRRGVVRIAERGRTVLDEGPDRIDGKYLRQFPEIRAFLGSRSRDDEGDDLPSDRTPDEIIRSSFETHEAAIRTELLNGLLDAPARFFERLVVRLLMATGYGSDLGGQASVVGRSGDGGIDGIVDQDPLGLDRVYVQAKRYGEDNPIGSPKILEFSGALAQHQAGKGVFITTSRFTDDARRTAARLPQRIVLIDGEQLARLMLRHGVGVRIADTLHLKRVDDDFFEE